MNLPIRFLSELLTYQTAGVSGAAFVVFFSVLLLAFWWLKANALKCR